MEENSRTLIFGAIAFFSGLIVGLGAGILVAPQSGGRTRRQLQNIMSDVQEDAENFVQDTKESVSDWVQQGKKNFSKS